ncbi:MAG: hypothetical protein UX68_C0006G0006 [Parcubacteria group bacterium GW2011_GWA2_46_9]|nr:MAG: hypothetical protein UX68_C0006G0006 [Parcubacteria group bacterium GW2011_GWA2_46_9]
MESDDIIKSMNYYHANTSTVVQNTDFRHVVYTAKNIQVVFMSVLAGEEIGEEVHDEHDQTFVFVAGEGKVIIGTEKIPVHPGDLIVIPRGVYHNVKSIGPLDLKLYSFCTPPHHPRGTVHPTKESAIGAQEH